MSHNISGERISGEYFFLIFFDISRMSVIFMRISKSITQGFKWAIVNPLLCGSGQA